MVEESGSQSPQQVSEEESALAQLRTSRRVSWILDECIRVPGTNLRFGLDPILGLVPYGGEAVATAVGAVILGDARKKGIPFKSLVRMGGNMLINAGIGSIPIFGDLFSVWFKSNSRNYRMLNTYMESEHGDEVAGGWWPVIFIFLTIGIVIVLNILSWILMTSLFVWLYRQIGTMATGTI